MYQYKMFVPHRKHTYGPPQPVIDTVYCSHLQNHKITHTVVYKFVAFLRDIETPKAVDKVTSLFALSKIFRDIC
jgi:hypothetical protein